ncbi:FxsA family protein [Candidatus Bipolaricaulota bacterium]
MPLLGFALLFLELTLLIVVGQGIGIGFMFLYVLLTGVLGAWLMIAVGRTAFQPAQLIGLFLHATKSRDSARSPAEGLLLGCLLLIIPGILTDIAGLVLIARFFIRRGSPRQSSSDSNSIDIEFDVRDDSQP